MTRLITRAALSALLLAGASGVALPPLDAAPTAEAAVSSVSTTLLTGTFLNTLDDPMFAQQFGPSDPTGCNAAGTSSVAFSGRGPVSGPLPGTIQVTGSYQIGPQTTSRDLGFPAQVGPITAFGGTFTISSGATTAQGTFERLGPVGGSVGLNEGACSGSAGPSGYGYANINSGALTYLDAMVVYSAVVTSPSGTSYAAGTTLFRQRQTCVDSTSPLFRGCGHTGPVMNFFSPSATSDTTPPTLSPTVTPAVLGIGDAGTVTPNAADPESQIAHVECDPVDTSAAGTFTVQCSATNGVGLTTLATATYTVQGPPPASVVSIDDVTVDEGVGTGRLLFHFEPQLSTRACLSFRMIDGSATRPADYSPNPGRTCFPAGTRDAVTGIPIVDDGLVEGSETFTVELYDLEDVGAGDLSGVWTITDNEPADVGTIEIAKRVLPASDPTTFDFTGVPALELGDGDVQTFTLPTGTYPVAETAVAGWRLTDLTCTDPTGNTVTNLSGRSATIVLDKDDVVRCTFENSKFGQIVVAKETNPDASAQAFDFSAEAFSSDVSVQFPLHDGETWTRPTLGPITISEQETVGWRLDGIDCVDPSNDSSTSLSGRSASAQVGPGETVTCTFRNGELPTTGSLVLTKQTNPALVPATGPEFGFTVDGSAGPALQSGESSSPIELTAGNHAIGESMPAGWRWSSARCTVGTTTVTATSLPFNAPVVAGQVTSCVVVNDRPANLAITKEQRNVSVAGQFTTAVIGAALGDTIEYRLRVTNDSVVANSDVTVTDTVAGAMRLAGTLPSGCQANGNTVTCALGSMAPGEVRDVLLRARVHFACDVVGTRYADTDPASGLSAETVAAQQRGAIVRDGDQGLTVCGAGGGDIIRANGGNDVVWGYGPSTYAGNRIPNTAAVTSSSADAVPGDNSATVEALVVDVADLGDDIAGGLGNDTIHGQDGADAMHGDAGADLMFGEVGFDTMFGDGDADNMFGQDGADTMLGGSGNDAMNGNAGADSMSGDDGDDAMLGEDGSDTMNGNAGEDTIRGGINGDTMTGGPGQDTMAGEDGPDDIDGGAENDAITGGDGNDQIHGGLGSDYLLGGLGDDQMAGDLGENRNDDRGAGDLLSGQDGNDLLLGQGGDDGWCNQNSANGCQNIPKFAAGAGVRTLVHTPQLQGGTGADRIDGGVGHDRLDGGPTDANNRLYGSGGVDFCSLGPVPGLGGDQGDPRDVSCELPSRGRSTFTSAQINSWYTWV